jgi:hypothetical protein
MFMGKTNQFTELDEANAKLEGKKPLTFRQRLNKKLKTWFANNYGWVLLFKLAPSLVLVGAFGGRPIRIGKLAAPSTVASIHEFLNYILGPMLILALVDTLHIGLSIYEEKWKIKEYAKRKREYENAVKSDGEHPLENEIKTLRDAINSIKIPEGRDPASLVKKIVFDKKFEAVLKNHGLHLEVFIDMLLRKNNYEYAPHHFIVDHEIPEDPNPIAKIMAPILSLTKQHNYQALWLQAQITLIRALYLRYQQHAPQDNKQLASFIQINLFSARLHKQLRAMKIDEDKFTNQIIETSLTPELAAKKLYHKDKKSNFDYAGDWLKTEVRCMRMNENTPIPAHLEAMLIEAKINKETFTDAVSEKNKNNIQFYEYNHSKIVDKFHCPTTDKSFAKENPMAAKGLKFFDYTKRLFIFPFRMLSLMLALEKLLPYSLPLEYSIPIYVSAGLCLSALIIFLEKMSDDYQEELQETRTNQLNDLHEAEQAIGVNRLFLKTQDWEDKQEIAALKQKNAALEKHKIDQENQLETMKRSASTTAMLIPSQTTGHFSAVEERKSPAHDGSPGSPITPAPLPPTSKHHSSHQGGGSI